MNDAPLRKGLPVVGILFLAVAFIRLVRGEDWVVWAILGALFGGFGIFRARAGRTSDDD